METKTTIKVTVTFPLGKEGPYQATLVSDTTIVYVLAQAMNHFGVTQEPNIVYYLTAHGEKQEPTTTVGQVAGQAEAVSFRLVKEITQG
jgi:hypothetical protein